jgi:rRNA pseudouridine-1189 N-methylase Emg1 (Nep1/Mra1 family)
MTDYSLSIPDKLLEKAHRVAQQTARNVDDVLLETLRDGLDEPAADLPESERAELKAMAYLSDDTLWTIAREQLPKALQERMGALMALNTRGSITEDERLELTKLVERGDQLILRKAQAMKYLTERGHRVTPADLKSTLLL